MPEADGEIKIKDKIYALRRQQCGSLICVKEFVKSPPPKNVAMSPVFADVRIQLRLMQVFAPRRKQHRSSDPKQKNKPTLGVTEKPFVGFYFILIQRTRASGSNERLEES